MSLKPSFVGESYKPDSLIAGDFPVRTAKVTVISGQNLVRGALLGKITASGKVNLSLTAATDGSQAVYGVLAEDVDATTGDAGGLIYLTGDFNSNAMTFGTGHTATNVLDAARLLGIFVTTGVSA